MVQWKQIVVLIALNMVGKHKDFYYRIPMINDKRLLGKPSQELKKT